MFEETTGVVASCGHSAFCWWGEGGGGGGEGGGGGGAGGKNM